jgi:hypothetical protein
MKGRRAMTTNNKRVLLSVAIIIVLIFSFAIKSLPIYADDGSEKSVNGIDSKLEEQNKDILNAIKDKGFPDNEEKINQVLELMDKSKSHTGKASSLKEVKTKIVKGFFNLALTLRKYVVPFYMFILVSNILLLSVFGAKSLQKRRAYIVGSAILTFVFVILMNIPIFIIYFQSNPFSEVVTIDSTDNGAYNLVYFLRNNSIALCAILFIYGVINTQLGKNDIPRKITGSYFKKTACWIFVILQILPFAINFIL